jgi:prepilin-type N-terminal cleavage/methylation domain-containing protein
MKNLYKSKAGFTIVELLVVIVVIAILAAITIVAYNGIQARGRTSSAAAGASALAKKIEAFNSITGAYPVFNTVGNITSQLSGQTESSLTGSGITITYNAPTSSNGTNTFQVLLCGATAPAAGATATGYKVISYDFTVPGTVTSQSGGTITNCSTSTSGS